MILITGATGQLGNATINFLLSKVPEKEIAALVRDEKKAASLKSRGVEIRIGDYDNYDSLLKAFAGVDKLFFVSGNDVPNRLKQHRNVVDAAKQAGVGHIFYTSFTRKNESATNPLGVLASSHIETERLIKESGLDYTIMLNGLYADALPMFFGEKVLETGIVFPAGDGKAAFTSRLDIAEAAANLLTTEGHQNKIYEISNTENYSFADAASILSELSGKAISYSSPAPEAYAGTLSGAGVPVEFIQMFTAFAEAIKQGEFFSSTSDLQKILGRQPVDLKGYLKTIFLN